MVEGASVRQLKAYFDSMDAEPGAVLSMRDFSDPHFSDPRREPAGESQTAIAVRADFYSDANVVACLVCLEGARPGWVAHHISVPSLDRSDEFEIAVAGAGVGIASAFVPGNLYYHKTGSVFVYGANAYFKAMFCIRGNTTHMAGRNYTFETAAHFIDLGRPQLSAVEAKTSGQYEAG